MPAYQEWTGSVNNALVDITGRVGEFIPRIVGAVIIIVVGWLIGALLEWAVENVLRAVGLQTLFEKAKVEDVLKKAESQKDTSGLIGSVVKWIILLVSFIAAADTLNLPQVSAFLNQILGYVPNVVAASAILLIGAIFAHFLAKVVSGSVKAARLGFATSAGTITKYAVLIFTIIATLSQLGVATPFLQTLFTGFVAMLAIAGGLAFGLGGQSAAKETIEKLRRETEISGK